jgi:4'-phosphopantetheinyl transferase
MTPEPLDRDTVRVRWLRVEAGCQAVYLQLWRSMLDVEELVRANQFRFAADRNTFTAAHALRRTMLSYATGLPTETWRYVEGPFGKPALAVDDVNRDLQFNISHTHGLVACAIASDPIGVDVEAADGSVEFDIMIDQVFAPEEIQVFKSAPWERRRCLFFRFWTLKEAFIKATGEGLTRPLSSFSFALDPVRITFHPERDDMLRHNNSAEWQFAECLPVLHRPLAVAIQRKRRLTLRLDIREARPEEVRPGR